MTPHRRSRRPWLIAALAIAATLFAGCGLTRSVTGEGPPVPAGPLGPIIQGDPGMPPIECRGVPGDSCRGFQTDTDGVLRIIITCTAACTPQRGDVRIDVLKVDGTTESRGQGSYENSDAAPLPQPAQTDGTY
jgi:hypothetical protein